jgi:carboxyl-terminal processing protease
MRRSKTWAIACVVLLPIVGGAFLVQAKAKPGADLLTQVLTLVSDRYVDTLSASDVYEKAASGLVRELNDPYSVLLTPADLKRFNNQTGGQYAGVGMQIVQQQNQTTVETVFPGTPAAAGGVREGDHIVQVDSTPTAGLSLDQVSDLLTGPEGTSVKARFSRPGVATPINLTFRRAIIHVPAVPYTLTMNGDVGYIPFTIFNENAAHDVQQAVQSLSAKGVHGIIIDMRGNPGGILTQSLEIANEFLKQGQEIASVKGRDSLKETYNAEHAPLAPAVPLIIMVNGNTASAAEIVTGALQDHDRALVVGQTSFGKGLVQTVYNLDGGYALKLTTAKWYTPSGRSIQRPRKYVNGQFVEVKPDSNETNASKKSRPTYHSDAGRVVYGGGGITPDVIVPEDTLTTAEQKYARAIAPFSQKEFTTRWDYTLELSKQKPLQVHVQPSWLDTFYKRLQSNGVTVDRKTYDAASGYIGYLLEHQVTAFALGDSAAKRVDLRFDAPLQKAIALMQHGTTQRALFAYAGEPLPQ